ncbi:helix-turn-helix domain-containing protein [Macrococcus brunensis]|uniref:helix-turn-helix domain-containing protein n=1 Tax=Macrococcus brunensis TaxID=198483 RepID=UPI001EEFB258|nr:helix-turn-helix transcriptional regulator [Macrococcus brunensis]ULG71922.1 helix-turn-helix transcriptional regulator [Macrococcus brunensis]
MNNKFRVILAIKSLSIKNVHEKTGISKTTLTNLFYERTRNPDTKTVLLICDFLGVTPNQFFGIDPLDE